MPSRYLSTLAGIILLALAPAFALANNSLSPVELARRLQARYEETRTMTADFKQTTSVPSASRKRLGAGKLVISKPGRIRWDYSAPDRQVLVSDGKKFSMYVASSKQMMVQPVTRYINSDVTYAFFSGTGNIVRDFNALAPERPVAPGEKTLKLVPKNPHPQVDYLHAWLDENFMVQRLEIVDHFGSVTDLVFSNIRRNEPVGQETFHFTPPAGTEIIEQ